MTGSLKGKGRLSIILILASISSILTMVCQKQRAKAFTT